MAIVPKQTLKDYGNKWGLSVDSNQEDLIDTLWNQAAAGIDLSALANGNPPQATDTFLMQRAGVQYSLTEQQLNDAILIKTQSATHAINLFAESIPYDSPTYGNFYFNTGNSALAPDGGHPKLNLGYNTDIEPVNPLPGEHQLGWRIQADSVSGGVHFVRSYWVYGNGIDYPAANNLSFRPLSFAVERNTPNTSNLYLNADMIDFGFPVHGGLPELCQTVVRIVPNVLTLFGNDTAIAGINVNAGAGQSGQLTLGYGAVDHVFILRTVTANKAYLIINDVYHIDFAGLSAGIAAPFFGIGSFSDAHLSITNTDDHLTSIRITANATQAVNLFEAKVGAATAFALTKNGYTRIGNVSAPADAEIATSTLSLWFDDTNGAGKLMIKAKTANGTVATGSVALT